MTDVVDPLLAELILWCRLCRTEVHPDDAAWLDVDAGVILLEFPAACVHAPEPRILTALVSALTLPADRCIGTTQAGTWCKRWPARDGGRYCRAHCGQVTACGEASR